MWSEVFIHFLQGVAQSLSKLGVQKAAFWLAVSDWLYPNPHTQVILAFSSFPPLGSQGDYNGGFQGPFCLSM
jgi:hypothetical protein